MPTIYFYRKIIFSGVLLFLLFFLITNFVDLEKLFFPKKYWEKQVISLQKNINLLEMQIRDKLLEIEKKDLTMDLDVQRSYNIFSQHGSFKINKDTMNKIIELHKIEKLKLQAELEDLINKFNKLKHKLEKAQMELEKHS